jgi:hypothetical protein
VKISELSALILCCAIALVFFVGCGSDDDDTSERDIWCEERCEIIAECLDGDVKGCTNACILSPDDPVDDCILNCETGAPPECPGFYPCRDNCISSSG